MREYTAQHCNGMPNWADVPAVNIDQKLHPTDANVTAQAQLCYNEHALYVRLSAQEEKIRAELTGTLDEICEDSCLEFFFCPTENDPRYFNIECNPNGCLFLGFGPNVEELVRLIPENPSIQPVAKRIPGGWETVYAIPYSFIRMFFPGFSPASGSTMRANFYKCGDKTEIPHYLCWNQVPQQRCAFHNPSAFGLVHFE